MRLGKWLSRLSTSSSCGQAHVHSTGNSRNSFTKLPCLLAALILTVHSTQAWSQQDQDKDREYDLRENNFSLSWLPGEKYNTFTGTMGHFITDLTYEGNGIPITVTRTDKVLRPQPQETHHMALSLPVLSFRTGFNGGGTGDCINMTLLNKYGQFSEASAYKQHSPVVFNIGGQAISFFSTRDNENPNAPGIARFPSNADYVSPSNWYIECMQHSMPPGGDLRDYFGYRVHSPDGMVYTMGKADGWRHRAYTDNALLRYMSKVVFRLTKVENAYGKSLIYTYSDSNTWRHDAYAPSVGILMSIEDPDDGRRVDFTYDYWNSRNYLRSVKSNALPNPHLVEYTYTNNFNTVDVEYDKTRTMQYDHAQDGKIRKITYPNGGTVVYNYNPTKFYAHHYMLNPTSAKVYGSYHMLTSRVLDDNTTNRQTTYHFRFNPSNTNTISRFVETPDTTLEFNYSKINKDGRYLIPRNPITPEQGKLLYVKNYGKVLNASETAAANAGTLSAIMDKRITYQYLDNSSVTTMYPPMNNGNGIQMSGASIIVPTMIKTTVKGTPNKVFKREFLSYDEYGMPTEIKETAGSGRIRYMDIAYRNNFTPWIRTKQQSVIIRGVSGKSFSYNEYGSVSRIVDNGVYSYIKTYLSGTNKGLVEETRDSQGNTHAYTAYSYGIPTREVDANGRVLTRIVQSDGTVKSETPWGQVRHWQYHYDSARRLTLTQSPMRYEGVRDSRITWDGLHHRTQTYVGTSNQMHTHYDGFGREIFSGYKNTRHGTLWSSVQSRYDGQGRLIYQSYPVNKYNNNPRVSWNLPGIHYAYDGLGRTTKITHDSGEDGLDTITQWSYDGMQVTTTDGRGFTSETLYDAFGTPSMRHIVRHEAANGVVTQYTRDADDQLRAYLRGGQLRSYSYNSNRQLAAQWIPENGSTHFDYHPTTGWLTYSTQGNTRIDYTYYPDGQYDTITFSGDGDTVTRTYTYNDQGLLSTLTNQSAEHHNQWTYTYDAENKLESESLALDGRTYTISYQYDDLSNLASIVYPNGRQYDYQPDSLGRARSIIDGEGNSVYNSITYHANGLPHILTRDTHQSINELNDAQRRSSRQLKRQTDGFVMAHQKYEYDAVSNLHKITDFAQPRTTDLEYDAVNRLTLAVISNADNWGIGYNDTDDITHMRQGNQTHTYHYDQSNRRLDTIHASGVDRHFSYNVQGDIITHDSVSSQNTLVTRQLQRNSAGQVSQLSQDGTSSSAMVYDYDGHGRRVKKSRYGAIYSIYGMDGKLRFRDDVQSGIHSEYLYVAGELVMRRDSEVSGNHQVPSGKPSAPSDVLVQNNNGTVGLSWAAVPQAEKYNIYRNNDYLTTVGNVTSYSDTDAPQETLSYQLVAIDEDESGDDKFSVKSEPVTINIADTSSDPAAANNATNFRATAYSSSSAELYWTAASDPQEGTAVEYEIYRDGDLLVTTSNGSSYWMSGLTQDAIHTFEIVALYASGARSEKSATITLQIAANEQSY